MSTKSLENSINSQPSFSLLKRMRKSIKKSLALPLLCFSLGLGSGCSTSSGSTGSGRRSWGEGWGTSGGWDDGGGVYNIGSSGARSSIPDDSVSADQEENGPRHKHSFYITENGQLKLYYRHEVSPGVNEEVYYPDDEDSIKRINEILLEDSERLKSNMESSLDNLSNTFRDMKPFFDLDIDTKIQEIKESIKRSFNERYQLSDAKYSLLEGHLKRAESYEKNNLVDNALEEYNQIIGIDPFNPFAHYAAGNIYRKKGMLQYAEAEWKKAIELQPDFADAHHNLGVYFYEQKDFRSAYKEWEEVKKIDQDYPNIDKNLELFKSKDRVKTEI